MVGLRGRAPALVGAGDAARAQRSSLRIHPRYTVWFHQHLDLVWAYGRSSQAGRRYAQLSGLRYYHHAWLDGTASNWQNHLPDGEASLTVELPAGALSASGVARQVRAVLGLGLR